MTSILASLSAIVESLPCVKGQPLVTVWGQIVIDRLHDLLTHSNADIRSIAGTTLATFSLICSGGGRVDDTYAHTSHAQSAVSTKDTSPRNLEESTYLQTAAGTEGKSSESHDGDTNTVREKEKEKEKDNEKAGHQEVYTQAISASTATGIGGALINEQEQSEEKDDDGAWLIEACLSRVGSSLSSAFEKKSKCTVSYTCASKANITRHTPYQYVATFHPFRIFLSYYSF